VNLTDAGREIKKELSGDEKVLESVFKLETLYKKYKFVLWTLVIAVVLFFIGRSVMQNMQETKLLEANEAYLILQTKPEDTQALMILKEKNPALYELFTYTQATEKEDVSVLEALSKSNNPVIADASNYAKSVLKKKPVDSILYNEMALFQQAYLEIKAGDVKSAKQKLNLIDERSPLFMIASLLKHSTIKVK